MKLLHLADLHIGKRLNEFSLLEDQRAILDRILACVDQEKPDVVLIAGDVYDKGVPPAEAVALLDSFLTALCARGCPICMVSGNHDSPERLGFGSRILGQQGVHVAGVFDGQVQSVILHDAHGAVHIHLLPFLKPAMVAPFFPESEIHTWQEALDAVVSGIVASEGERHVLVAHQFVTTSGQDPERSDSETFQVGGADNIDAETFAPFDYVALGHLHGPQRIGRDTIRYAGSPLKYSFSECRHHKSIPLIELHEKGRVEIRLLPLIPLRDMRELRGPLEELLLNARFRPDQEEDYIRAILTDAEEPHDALGKLRQVYPNLMRIDFDNARTRALLGTERPEADALAGQSPMTLFEEFYRMQNGEGMNEVQRKLMTDLLQQLAEKQEGRA